MFPLFSESKVGRMRHILLKHKLQWPPPHSLPPLQSFNMPQLKCPILFKYTFILQHSAGVRAAGSSVYHSLMGPHRHQSLTAASIHLSFFIMMSF